MLLEKFKKIFSINSGNDDHENMLELSLIQSDLRECNRSQLKAVINLISLVQTQELSGEVVLNDYYLTFNNGLLVKVFDLKAEQNKGL